MQHQTRRSHRFAASVLVAVLASAGHARAQDDIAIVPVLRAGESFQLEVIRIRENSMQPQQNSRSTTRVDVRVLSASPEETLIEWVPGATLMENPQAASNPLVAMTSQALRDVRFQLRLNPDGELQEMVNQGDVAPKLKSVVDAVVAQLSAQMPEADRKPFLDLIHQVLSTEVLMATAIRDASTYLGLNGVTLAAGEALEADLEQPSPLGGGTLPTKLRIRMDSADAERASLTTTTTYDAAALMRMTEAVTRQAGAAIPPEELAKLPPMTMSDEGAYVFDRTLGLIREARVRRRVAVGANGRLDAWEIRLISGPR